jgi:DNA-binding MarR family transcriptional regulator
MEQVRLLDQLVSKTAPGRSPDFTKAHILYALILLRAQRIGRKQLAEELHLGEGTIRTMLSRLQDMGLIEISRPGVTLSDTGNEYLNAVTGVLMWKPLPDTEITVDEINWAVIVRGASSRIRLGVEQRDQALIHGATGATTMIYQQEAWVLPGIDEEVEDQILKSLSEFDPNENDVAVIGTSSNGFTATLGALAAALDLLG